MKHIALKIAFAGAFAAVVPFLAYAEDGQDDIVPPPTPVPMMQQNVSPQNVRGEQVRGVRGMRPENAENNRDFRNAALRRVQDGAPLMMSSSTRPMMLRIQDDQDNEAEGRPELPRWITASSSPFRGEHLGSTTMMELMRAARFASTTDLDGHEKRKEARLVEFAQLQSNLISQLTRSLNLLKESRNKIADRIQSAQQSGRDMTEAVSLLATADAKIALADQAVQGISILTPSVSTGSTVTASTTVSLEHPREIGKAAIQAVHDARKALNDVVVAIAHGMGFRVDEDGRIIPPPATATTTPSATSTPVATTTQQ